MSTLLETYKAAVKKLEYPEKDEINIRILLCHLAKIETMTDFYIKGDQEFKRIKTFNNLFEKYLSGVPIDYLIHSSKFYGHDFYVDSRVLIPRQETEEVVDFAIKKLREIHGDKPLVVADICTGSGCIGITLALHLNVQKLYLTDISEKALEVTKKNVDRYMDKLPKTIIRQGDGMYPLIIDENFEPDVIIANPPYIIDKKKVDPSVDKHEPKLALYTDNYAGVYRSIMFDLMELPHKNIDIFFEISDEIDNIIGNFARTSCPQWKPTSIKDMNGHYRILYMRKS